jgi:YVTN family beta-propeller protein
MKSAVTCFSILALAIILSGSRELSAATNAPASWPGLQPDGSMLLPNQWSLRPAGQQIELDNNLPVNIALSPDGKYAAILHCGYKAHEVVIVDLAAQKTVDRAKLGEAFYGLTFSRDGKKIYCGGASMEVVYLFDFSEGKLGERKNIRLRPVTEIGVPTGVAVDPAGKILYAADMWSSRISRVTLADKSVTDIPLTSEAAPQKAVESNAKEDFDTAAALKRARALELAATTDVNGLFPYTCVVDAKHDRLYVSLWGAAAVMVLDTKTNAVIARWPAGQHPCEMALTRDGKRLFVANANENTVTVLDTTTGRASETLWATLFPNSPPGATPNSLALSPDEKTLFVANANINAVAVFDVADAAHGRSLGFIPTGWYPTSVRVTPDGKRLLVANGKGNLAMANPDGPEPVAGRTKKEGSDKQYTGSMYDGTLSVVELPSAKNLEAQMSAWTTTVLKCTPLRPDASVAAARPADNPVPDKIGAASPIKHCIYIIKENRTYDQVFGDIAEGNGDSNLCIFPARVTPNLHQLVQQFVLLDNFYADAEVSASGHEWSMGAIASDFVEKTWPLNYGHKKTKFPYPAEGVFAMATPKNGYLWNRAAEAGVSFRSYGEFVGANPTETEPAVTKNKSLIGHYDPWYHGFGLDYSDMKRADRFISELQRFEKKGDLPQLQIVRLGNDHTHGVTPGQRTPTAYVADNDASVGRVVDAVSHSIFWTNTAVFIIEDDAQNGSDHVDAHRTEALVVSPYTKRKAVDSTLYSTTSMLRTMELILGLQPMTQFDAAATPMFNSFQPQPDFAPYVALPPNVDLTETNTTLAWGAKEKFNFAKEDANDDLKFNEVIWRSVKGSRQPMPAPIHAGFVLARAGSKDDDDD